MGKDDHNGVLSDHVTPARDIARRIVNAFNKMTSDAILLDALKCEIEYRLVGIESLRTAVEEILEDADARTRLNAAMWLFYLRKPPESAFRTVIGFLDGAGGDLCALAAYFTATLDPLPKILVSSLTRLLRSQIPVERVAAAAALVDLPEANAILLDALRGDDSGLIPLAANGLARRGANVDESVENGTKLSINLLLQQAFA